MKLRPYIYLKESPQKPIKRASGIKLRFQNW